MSKGPSIDYNKMSSNKDKDNRPNPNRTNYKKSEHKKAQNFNSVTETKIDLDTKEDTQVLVKVDIERLNIRTGPGKNYDKTGKYTGIGTFAITEMTNGEGSDSGWGRLKSGEGWISLEYATRV